MPRVVDIVVGRVVHLPRRQLRAKSLLGLPGRGEWVSPSKNGSCMGSRPSEACRSRANCFAASDHCGAPSRSKLLNVTDAMAWLGSPARVRVIHAFVTVHWVMAATWSALRSSTAKAASHMARVGARIAYWIWPMRRRDVVGRRLPGDGDELVQRPAAGMRQHGFLHHLRGRVHEADRVDGAWRAGDRMGMGDAAAGRLALPRFRMLAFERVDPAPIGRAGGVPEAAVGQRGKRVRVEAEGGVQAIVIAVRGMHGLGAAHLFSRFAEKHERTADAVLLHGALGRQETGERPHAERGMRIGMTGRVPARPLARLA